MQLKLAGIPVPLWWKILAKNFSCKLKETVNHWAHNYQFSRSRKFSYDNIIPKKILGKHSLDQIKTFVSSSVSKEWKLVEITAKIFYKIKINLMNNFPRRWKYMTCNRYISYGVAKKYNQVMLGRYKTKVPWPESNEVL